MHKKYKVLIEATRLVGPLRDGCWRYVYELLRAMCLESSNYNLEIDLYINGNIIPLDKIRNHLLLDRHPRALRTGRLSRIYSKVTFLLSNRLKQYDLIHFTTPIRLKPFLRQPRKKLLVTIHDLTHKFFPDLHTAENVIETENGIEFALKNGISFIAVSQSTKTDFVSEYHVAEEKVKVIYEGADHQKFKKNENLEAAAAVRKKYSIPDTPYFLALSTLEPRKNIKTIVEAFEQFIQRNPDANVKLVIAGKRGWKWEEMKLEKYSCHNAIVFTGYIEEKDLSTIYSGALAFCYLSFYEGFGLPPVEALCCGTPVIYSEVSSLKEILEGSGIGVNPYSPIEASDAMEKLWSDPVLRTEYSSIALAASKKFDWSQTAIQTIKEYLRIVHLFKKEKEAINVY